MGSSASSDGTGSVDAFIASSVVPKRTESPVGASCTIPLDGRRLLAVRQNSHNICIRRETIATTGE